MSIRKSKVVCPACGTAFSVNTTNLGKKSKCAKCFSVFVLAESPLEPVDSNDNSPDALNNRALVAIKSGRPKQAEEIWKQALSVDPQHPESVYNQSLYRRHTLEYSEFQFIDAVEQMRQSHHQDGRSTCLLAQAYLDRGDVEAAQAMLEDLEHSDVVGAEARSLLETCRSTEPAKCVGTIETEHSAYSLVFAPDGSQLLMGSHKRLMLWDIRTGETVSCMKLSGNVEDVQFGESGPFALSCDTSGFRFEVWDVLEGRCVGKVDWDKARMGKPRGMLHEEKDEVLKLSCLTADGKFVLTLSEIRELGGGNYLRLWDVASGKCAKVDCVGGKPTVLTCSANGKSALLAWKDGDLAVWGLPNLERIRTCRRDHRYGQANTQAACLSPNGRVAVGASEEDILLWDLARERCFQRFHGSKEPISVHLSLDGRFVASADFSSLRLWDTASARCLRSFDCESTPRLVCIAPDGDQLVSSDLHAIQVWNISQFNRSTFRAAWHRSRIRDAEERRHAKQNYAERIQNAEESLSRKDVASALEHAHAAQQIQGQQSREEDIALKRRIGIYCRTVGLRSAWRKQIVQIGYGAVLALNVSPDGRLILAGEQWELKVWGKHRQGFKDCRGARSATFSPDGKRLLAANEDGKLTLWDVGSGKLVREFVLATGESFQRGTDDGLMFQGIVYETRGGAGSVSFSADGRFAISAHLDCCLRLWGMESNDTCLAEFDCGHRPNSVRISADAICALSAGYESEYVTHQDQAAYGISGESTATGEWKQTGTLEYWDLVANKRIWRAQTKSQAVLAIDVRPDGALAVSGHDDGLLCQWDLRRGEHVKDIGRCSESIWDVRFTPDGRFVLVTGTYGSAQFWNVETGQVVHTLRLKDSQATSLAITPNGRFALVGTSGGHVEIWELDWEYEFPEWADWDEGATPYLEQFLTLHTPVEGSGLRRTGSPVWEADDFRWLINDLRQRGFGWLRPEGVRNKLDEMAANWNVD